MNYWEMITGLLGNPMAQNVAYGAQPNTGAASFGGFGGPPVGGFESFPQASPFAAGSMPNLVEPEQAVTYPLGVTPTIDPRTPPIFPDASGMPDLTKMPAGQNAGGLLGGMPFNREEPRAPGSAGTARMNQMAPWQWMQMAQLRRNERRNR